MTNLSYFERKRQLVAVFTDTMQWIDSSRELQTAVNQSIASQQYIGDADKIDLPAPPNTEKAQVWSTVCVPLRRRRDTLDRR